MVFGIHTHVEFVQRHDATGQGKQQGRDKPHGSAAQTQQTFPYNRISCGDLPSGKEEREKRFHM